MYDLFHFKNSDYKTLKADCTETISRLQINIFNIYKLKEGRREGRKRHVD
jgi:hypothetical protein